MLPQFMHVAEILIKWPLNDILQIERCLFLRFCFDGRVLEKWSINSHLGSNKLNAERAQMIALASNVSSIDIR